MGAGAPPAPPGRVMSGLPWEGGENGHMRPLLKKNELEALLSNDDLPKMLGSETILNYMPISLALQTYRTAIAAGA